MKVATAASERSDRRPRPHTPWPLVQPLPSPVVVMGFSLLTLFVNLRWTTGFWTIVIAHVMFCVSYVATTVKARIRGFDWRLEEAAADLGAGPVRTFTKVTFPIIAPGVFAAALLTFALSLDDFTVTYFNSGKVRTFPVEVFTQKRSRVPAQIDVFGTMILLAAALFAALLLLNMVGCQATGGGGSSGDRKSVV